MKETKEQSLLLADSHIPVMDRGFLVFLRSNPTEFQYPHPAEKQAFSCR